jgi:hypothetical protein
MEIWEVAHDFLSRSIFWRWQLVLNDNTPFELKWTPSRLHANGCRDMSACAGLND